MRSEQLDDYWNQLQSTANKYQVSVYRESAFPLTSLFPASATEDQEVVVIYKEPRLVQYEQMKKDLSSLPAEEGARRFGRLLGYSPQGINDLLMKNTAFRTLESFKVRGQTTHLYYEDLAAADSFYREVLGLTYVEGVGFMIGKDASIMLHFADEDHPIDQPKSTAIALLTDQLPEWNARLENLNVPIKFSYKPREGGPHDGLVAIDPGGYLLEFEQFKQHPENELLMAVLENTQGLDSSNEDLGFYGSITWTYHQDLLQMQQFYEEVLGFRMVADQGWTKIYQTSATGFVGLVDEKRGMMDYAAQKAVEIEWKIRGIEGASTYFSGLEFWLPESQSLIGPERYLYRLR